MIEDNAYLIYKFEKTKGGMILKLIIEQSSDNKEIEINIKCGQVIDEKLQRLIDQIRLYSFSIIGKKDKEIYQISLKDV